MITTQEETTMNLTEQELTLYNRLVSEGGWSENDQYAPLVDKLQAWMYNTDTKRFYILKNGQVGIYTIMLRIPVLSHGMNENMRERTRLETFKVILSKFVLKFALNQKNVEDCKKIFMLFMFFPFTLCVPSFFKDELVELLKKAEADYYEISPNFVRTTCPVCDYQVRVDARENMVTCPECGSNFGI